MHSLYGNKYNSSEEMDKFLTAKDQTFQSYNATILIIKKNIAQALKHEWRDSTVKIAHIYECCD